MRSVIDELELIPFHPRHLEVADLVEHEKDALDRNPKAYEKMEELNNKSMQAVTVLRKGRILMCCGFIKLWPGVAELWLLPTVYIEENCILFCKTIKMFIESIVQTNDIHRLQADCKDDAQHVKFMEFLGFEDEGTLRQYSDKKENFKKFSRLFPSTERGV